MHIIPELWPSLLMVLPFLVAYFALRAILWAPLMQYLDERDLATVGAKHEAEAFNAQAEQRAATLEIKLAAARKETQDIHLAARTRALAKEAEIIAAARVKAEEYVAEAHARVADERLKAKAELDANARSLSADIVDALLA